MRINREKMRLIRCGIDYAKTNYEHIHVHSKWVRECGCAPRGEPVHRPENLGPVTREAMERFAARHLPKYRWHWQWESRPTLKKPPASSDVSALDTRIANAEKEVAKLQRDIAIWRAARG